MTAPPTERRWHYYLTFMREALIGLERVTVPVTEMPDAAGQVREIERRLATLRQGWNQEQMSAARDPESDVGPPTFQQTPFGTQRVEVTGREYRTVTTRSAKRTYNTAAIIHGLAGALTSPTDQEPFSPTEALLWAVRRGVASVEWKWQRLQQVAKEYGLPMRVVPRPITDDGDISGPWVGEKWTEKIGQEAVTDEGSSS